VAGNTISHSRSGESQAIAWCYQSNRGPVRSEALPHTGPRPSEAGARWYPAGKASLPGPLLRVRRGAWRAFPIPARPLAEGAC
jgi:hypothetical protein